MMERFRKHREYFVYLLALAVLFLLDGTVLSVRRSILSSRHENSVAVKKNLTKNSADFFDDEATIDMRENPYWWEPYVDQIARPFSIRPDKSWCVPKTVPKYTSLTEKNINKGLYLVKIQKTASSTVAGVSIQIARNIGEQQYDKNSTECTYHVAHGSEFVHRQDPFFLWTVLRDPRKRAISHYYFFDVSRNRRQATPTRMIRDIQSQKNHQFSAVSPKFKDHAHANATEIVNMLRDNVFDKYHFVGLSDRMDETLVALKFILQIDLKDIVVLSSKRNGGFDDGRFQNTCFKIQPANNISQEVDQFLEEKFPVHNHDFFLYAVANRSLDLTIDAIGGERFQQDLDKFRLMSSFAEERCLDKAIFPCVADGMPPLPGANTSCYFGDIGCGHACVKDVLQNYDAAMD